MKPNFLKRFIGCLLTLATFTTALGMPPKVAKKAVIKWAVQKTSTLRITGKTNLAGFGCDIKGYYQTDTIVYTESEDLNRIVPLQGALNIDINKFDCHNKMLTSDLRKTLKAIEHPNLVVRFIALERMPAFANNKDVVKGWVDVELAGVNKRFDIDYKLEKKEGVIQLNGDRSFCFSDFKLTPPKKLGGIVRVKDDFYVNFKLVLSEVN